jgi:membrane protease YdiL (CAAX protease family)
MVDQPQRHQRTMPGHLPRTNEQVMGCACSFGHPQVSLFLFSIFPGSAMGEELGWRGFALPRLQVGRNALAASLVVGTVWGTYHLPLFLLGSPTRPFALFLPFASAA